MRRTSCICQVLIVKWVGVKTLTQALSGAGKV
jgi:hypothetical protein